MPEIDVEKLIAGVQKHPALYKPDRSCTKKQKFNMWFEIAKEVFVYDEPFEEMSRENKLSAIYELQRRWRGLRTCFTRELLNQKHDKLRKQQKGIVKKRKRYEHFDQLSFLLEKDGDNEEEESESETETDHLAEILKQEVNESSHISNNSEEEPRISVVNYPTTSNIDERILELLKDTKTNEEDEDRQFMLSLIPTFKKMDDRQKMDAKIGIMRVMKDVMYNNYEA